jgi:hypothetical protein
MEKCAQAQPEFCKKGGANSERGPHFEDVLFVALPLILLSVPTSKIDILVPQ